jgi:BTB/POZ domain
MKRSKEKRKRKEREKEKEKRERRSKKSSKRSSYLSQSTSWPSPAASPHVVSAVRELNKDKASKCEKEKNSGSVSSTIATEETYKAASSGGDGSGDGGSHVARSSSSRKSSKSKSRSLNRDQFSSSSSSSIAYSSSAASGAPIFADVMSQSSSPVVSVVAPVVDVLESNQQKNDEVQMDQCDVDLNVVEHNGSAPNDCNDAIGQRHRNNNNNNNNNNSHQSVAEFAALHVDRVNSNSGSGNGADEGDFEQLQGQWSRRAVATSRAPPMAGTVLLPVWYGNPSGFVKFNVGGSLYTTTRSTLFSKGENFLTLLVRNDDEGKVAAVKDEQGAFFIDRSPEGFSVVLEFLRTGRIFRPANVSTRQLDIELDFYQIFPRNQRRFAEDAWRRAVADASAATIATPSPTSPNHSSTSLAVF